MTRPLQPEALGTILSVWAHPDDETYLAGGTMAAARDHGLRVVCASATAGELGTGDPVTWPPDRLGPMRRLETAAAMSVLGIDDHRSGNLPDGGLSHCSDAGRAWVEALIDDIAPDTILTFGSDGVTYHPDHVAVHHWVTDVWRRRGCVSRLLHPAPTTDHLARFAPLYEEWGMYMSDERPAGVTPSQLALHVVLDGAARDRKLVALRAMASQTSDLVHSTGLDQYLDQIADESFVEAAPASLTEATVARRAVEVVR